MAPHPLIRIATAAALACTLASAAAAPQGGPQPTVVSLQAHAESEVPNDRMVALLASEASGQDPASLAAEVNRRSAAAMAAAKAVPGVEVRSAGYRSEPIYKDGRIESWRVSQDLRLEAGDFTAAAQLIGRLQAHLLLRSLSVELSAAARSAAEDGLIARALGAFRARAQIVSRAMSAAGYRIRQLDVATAGEGYPRPLAMAATRGAVPLAVEPGTTRVTVTVSGSIDLRR